MYERTTGSNKDDLNDDTNNCMEEVEMMCSRLDKYTTNIDSDSNRITNQTIIIQKIKML